jgi:hypothetical protein
MLEAEAAASLMAPEAPEARRAAREPVVDLSRRQALSALLAEMVEPGAELEEQAVVEAGQPVPAEAEMQAEQAAGLEETAALAEWRPALAALEASARTLPVEDRRPGRLQEAAGAAVQSRQAEKPERPAR